MKSVTQRVSGRLVSGGDRFALLLHEYEPEKDATESLYLRYPLVTKGLEERLFPTLILDDWGGEIKSLGLYDWFADFAAQFPRAEVFGLDMDGKTIQRFMREFELYGKLPCYAYPERDAALTDGVLVEAILLPVELVETPEKIKRPSWVKRPLRYADASWWRVNPTIAAFDFLWECESNNLL